MAAILNPCKSCKHFDGESEELSRDGNGQCRRRSPTTVLLLVPAVHPLTRQTSMVPKQYSLFPQVSGEGCYCSEFEEGGRSRLQLMS